MGEDAAVHVDALVERHADEQVGILHTRLLQCLHTGGRGMQGHEVVVATHTGQSLLVFVDEHHVLVGS